MPSYDNDLRLKLITTGDESGTWGDSTNTNLGLIADSFGFGTESITTNANTHTSTIADGAADEARAFYIKYTGALDSNCTVTIGPNDIKKTCFIENATTDSGSSGPYSLVIKQGSGTEVTILNGQVKAVYLDGGGASAAVNDAFQDLAVPDLFVDDDLTLQSDSAVLGFGADKDTTLTHTDGSGLTLNSTNKLMFNDASQFIQGSSATVLSIAATDEIDLTATAIDVNGSLDVSGAITSSSGATITVSDNSDTLSLVSTDADASNGPILRLYRNSSTPANNDFLGNIQFVGRNNNTQDVQYAEEEVYILDASDGTEDGLYNINVITGGTNLSYLQLKAGTGSVFNEDSNDIDFRVESNGDANAFFVDAGNDKIGVLTNAPSGQFHVYNGMLQVGSKTGDTSVQQNTNAIRIAAVPNSSTEWGGLQWYREFSDYIGAEIIAARASSTESDTDLIFKTSTSAANATERFRVAHSGEIQIGGTTNAGFLDFDGNKLQLNTQRNPNTGTFVNTGKSHASIVLNGSDGGSKIQFYTDDGNNTVATERVTIDTEGRVGVGDTTPTTGSLAVAGVLALEPGGPVSIDASNSRPNLARNADGELRIAAGKDTNGFITFHVTPSGSTNVAQRFKIADNITYFGRSGTSPIFSLVNQDTEDVNTGRESSLRFSGFRSGGESVDNSQISGNHVGSADDDKGGMFFYTNGGSGLGERMRITNEEIIINEDGNDQNFRVESDSNADCFFVDAGNNLVTVNNSGGTFVGSTATSMHVRGGSTGSTSPVMMITDGDASVEGDSTILEVSFTEDGSFSEARYITFRAGSSGTQGSIKGTGDGTVTYSASSDERLKENIEDTASKWDALKAIKVRDFNWKNSGKFDTGFIAQELNEHWPNAVSEGGENLSHDPWSVDYGKLTPILTKALQEAMEKIETLEAEVAKLKGE